MARGALLSSLWRAEISVDEMGEMFDRLTRSLFKKMDQDMDNHLNRIEVRRPLRERQALPLPERQLGCIARGAKRLNSSTRGRRARSTSIIR